MNEFRGENRLRLSKFHFVLAFVALMLLRVVVGLHFFTEGTDKLKSGDFSAEYFLRAARGPFAPWFHAFLPDRDGRLKFGVTQDNQSLDPELTLAIWDDFLDRVHSQYRFGDPHFAKQLDQRKQELQEKLAATEKADELAMVRDRLGEVERDLLQLNAQRQMGEKILESHSDELLQWLAENEAEVVAWVRSSEREQGFDRDGGAAIAVASEVESLREQVDTIRSDRSLKENRWSSELKSIWDSYEAQLLKLPVDLQRVGPPPRLHRPFDQRSSKLNWINAVIPWFDTIVGALLVVGLFTRFASLAAGLFLVSVLATQPFWVPGVEPTWFYAIELMALLVIFAVGAGRFGGLDFFLVRRSRAAMIPETGSQTS